MVGYAPNGYRMWDPVARHVTIARDVKFDESCFPYAVMSQEDDVPLVVHFPLEQEGENNQLVTIDEIDQANEEKGVNDEDSIEAPENALPSPTERREIPRELSSRSSGRERLANRFPQIFQSRLMR